MLFSPQNRGVGVTVTLSATTSSAGAALPTPTGSLGGSALLITNTGAVTAFVRIGEGAQTALTSDLPIRAGSSLIIPRGQATHVATILGSSTATVFVSLGDFIV
jgi:hypothetical protein